MKRALFANLIPLLAPPHPPTTSPPKWVLLDNSLDDELSRRKIGSIKRTKGSLRKKSEKMLAKMEKELARVDAQIAERNISLDSSIFEQPLHLLDHVDENTIWTLKRKAVLKDFVSKGNDSHTITYFSNLEDCFLGQIRGTVLYVKPLRLSKNDDASSSDPEEGEVDPEVVLQLRKLLAEYSPVVIEPYPGELVCEVSVYQKLAPLVVAAKDNVRQMKKDCEQLMENFKNLTESKAVFDPADKPLFLTFIFNLGKESAKWRAHPPPVRSQTPEMIAAEVATRIKTLLKATVGNSPSSLRVCIGVAPTPVLAKLACETEVALQQKNYKLHASGDRLVCVRSLLGYLQNGRNIKRFVADFKFSQLPTVKKTFAQLLKQAFDVETCDDFYKKKNLLYFVLPRSSFECGYASVFGCLHFPEEEVEYGHHGPEKELSAVELSKETFLSQHKKSNQYLYRHLSNYVARVERYWKPFAQNDIALLTPDGKAMRAQFLKIFPFYFTSLQVDIIEHTSVYGRLLSDEEFMQIVEKSLWRCFLRLLKSGAVCGGMRVDLRRSHQDIIYHAQLQFLPPQKDTNSKSKATKKGGNDSEKYETNDYEVLREGLYSIQDQLLRYRARPGVEVTGDEYKIVIILQKLRLQEKFFIPERLLEEIQAVETEFRTTLDTFRGSAAFSFVKGTKVTTTTTTASQKNQMV